MIRWLAIHMFVAAVDDLARRADADVKLWPYAYARRDCIDVFHHSVAMRAAGLL